MRIAPTAAHTPTGIPATAPGRGPLLWIPPAARGARAAPVWGRRRFLRGCVVFYAQATGIQEGSQIGRGVAQNSWAGFRAFWSVPIGVVLVYWPVRACLHVLALAAYLTPVIPENRVTELSITVLPWITFQGVIICSLPS